MKFVFIFVVIASIILVSKGDSEVRSLKDIKEDIDELTIMYLSTVRI